MSNSHLQLGSVLSRRHLDAPATPLLCNLEVSARRYPDKPSLIYYDTAISFAEVREQARRIGGFLEQRCDVHPGDRVLLFMQNSPQFVIGYYGILNANAVVVPLNPMYLTPEILRCARDCGASIAIVAQELYPRIAALLEGGELHHVIVATYSDYLRTPTTLPVPDFVQAPRVETRQKGLSLWRDAVAVALEPSPPAVALDDLCLLPYTSGTTGEAKGCMHTHRTVMHTTVASMRWFSVLPEQTMLAVAPFFHVTGMQGSMNGPIYNANTVVLLPRWDRVAAAECVQRYHVASWTAVPTMIQDFFANPQIDRYDLSSVQKLSGGGAAMPAAVAQRLADRGITYYEGYGLTETMAATHINPPERAKKQCLGIPIHDVDSRIMDPHTLTELPQGEVGEIVTHGPQVFRGYWNKPEATAEAFIEIEGKRFFRTGDLGRVDEEGYFFMVDRLKRMINAAGFKVWPSEVESLMYAHPAVLEACVIGTRDARRGETVKAVLVLRPEYQGKVAAEEIVAWCRNQMAAYKVPRLIEFATTLPKSGSGKIQWRELQEQENKRTAEMPA